MVGCRPSTDKFLSTRQRFKAFDISQRHRRIDIVRDNRENERKRVVQPIVVSLTRIVGGAVSLSVKIRSVAGARHEAADVDSTRIVVSTFVGV